METEAQKLLRNIINYLMFEYIDRCSPNKTITWDALKPDESTKAKTAATPAIAVVTSITSTPVPETTFGPYQQDIADRIFHFLKLILWLADPTNIKNKILIPRQPADSNSNNNNNNAAPKSGTSSSAPTINTTAPVKPPEIVQKINNLKTLDSALGELYEIQFNSANRPFNFYKGYVGTLKTTVNSAGRLLTFGKVKDVAGSIHYIEKCNELKKLYENLITPANVLSANQGKLDAKIGEDVIKCWTELNQAAIEIRKDIFAFIIKTEKDKKLNVGDIITARIFSTFIEQQSKFNPRYGEDFDPTDEIDVCKDQIQDAVDDWIKIQISMREVDDIGKTDWNSTISNNLSRDFIALKRKQRANMPSALSAQQAESVCNAANFIRDSDKIAITIDGRPVDKKKLMNLYQSEFITAHQENVKSLAPKKK